MSNSESTGTDPADPVDPDDEIDFSNTKFQQLPDVMPSNVQTDDEDHAVLDALGEDHDTTFKYDPRRQGERVAFRYASPKAALREYIANSESALIRRARSIVPEQTDISSEEADEMSPWDILTTAREKTDYNPRIKIAYSEQEADMPDLVIDDNGCGVSITEWQIIEHVGLSGNHANGDIAGEMGQGLMSGFNFCGKHGMFKMVTHSINDDSNYAMKWHIDEPKPIDGKRQVGPGTRFVFPAVTGDIHDLDIKSELERICQLVRVPVVYEAYDSDGSLNTDEPEEFLPQRLDDLVDSDQPSIIYEDDMVMAVANPSIGTSYHMEQPKGFMTCQPIAREGASSLDKNASPYHFHLWLKREDYPIWICNCDGHRDGRGPHRGKQPIEHAGYIALDEEEKSNYVDMAEIDMGEHVQLAEPVDDKDRLKEGHGDMYREIGDRLFDEWRSLGSELMERAEASDPSTFREDATSYERSIFYNTYQFFTKGVSQPDVDEVKDIVADTFDVDISEPLATHLIASQDEVELAPRDKTATRVATANGRVGVNVSEVLDKAADGGQVWMAKTLTMSSKVDTAWEMHENNQVVKVDEYEYYADTFGWKKLKEIDMYNLSEQFPDHPEIHHREKTRSNSRTNRYRGVGTTDQDPTERYVKVRRGTGDQYSFHRYRGHRVFGALDGDAGPVIFNTNGSHSQDRVDRLVIYRQSEHPSDVGTGISNAPHAGYALVPNYVYDYLLEADRVYESVEEMSRDMLGNTHIALDISTNCLEPAVTGLDDNRIGQFTPDGQYDVISVTDRELTSDDLVVAVQDEQQAELYSIATGIHDTLDPSIFTRHLEDVAANMAGYDINDRSPFASHDRVVFMTYEEMKASWPAFETDVSPEDAGEHTPTCVVDETPTVLFWKGAVPEITASTRFHTTDIRDLDELVIEATYPPEMYPRDSAEWAKFGPSSMDDEWKIEMIEQLEAGAPDDAHPFPSQRS
ncbi:hypothetical protein [Halosegnis longus]|uniref:hypothetical protein n=1 Tax=Halosegnis longus TaxID=2216012 RepID=UPI00129EC822|nr:hypothetical protein [Halosegnis longus]